jgi:hypothetical protein
MPRLMKAGANYLKENNMKIPDSEHTIQALIDKAHDE